MAGGQGVWCGHADGRGAHRGTEGGRRTATAAAASACRASSQSSSASYARSSTASSSAAPRSSSRTSGRRRPCRRWTTSQRRERRPGARDGGEGGATSRRAIQAQYRGKAARKDFVARKPSREWRFLKVHKRLVGTERGANVHPTTVFHAEARAARPDRRRGHGPCCSMRRVSPARLSSAARASSTRRCARARRAAAAGAASRRKGGGGARKAPPGPPAEVRDAPRSAPRRASTCVPLHRRAAGAGRARAARAQVPNGVGLHRRRPPRGAAEAPSRRAVTDRRRPRRRLRVASAASEPAPVSPRPRRARASRGARCCPRLRRRAEAVVGADGGPRSARHGRGGATGRR